MKDGGRKRRAEDGSEGTRTLSIAGGEGRRPEVKDRFSVGNYMEIIETKNRPAELID